MRGFAAWFRELPSGPLGRQMEAAERVPRLVLEQRAVEPSGRSPDSWAKAPCSGRRLRPKNADRCGAAGWTHQRAERGLWQSEKRAPATPEMLKPYRSW